MGVQFGSFDSICQTAALVICPLLGSDQGIEPTCYSRNVDNPYLPTLRVFPEWLQVLSNGTLS
jgi:Chitin synthase export chaperone